MNSRRIAISLLLWMFCAAPLHAAPEASVEGVVMPAWVERAGVRQPLAAGMTLAGGDLLITGGGARVWLRLAEGSRVKMGENGRISVGDLGLRQDGGQLFSMALDVLRGAFRFTTEALSRFRGERDVRIRISTITAGVRGTDLWGKSADDKDILCLIEGRLQVARGGGEPFVMQDPMSFYVSPREGEAKPVAPVPPEQIRKWALETEIVPGQGAAREGGRWKVHLASFGNQQDALAAYDLLRENGYAVQIRPQPRDGAWEYRLRIAQLPDREEALALANRLKGHMGVTEPAVSQ